MELVEARGSRQGTRIRSHGVSESQAGWGHCMSPPISPRCKRGLMGWQEPREDIPALLSVLQPPGLQRGLGTCKGLKECTQHLSPAVSMTDRRIGPSTDTASHRPGSRSEPGSRFLTVTLAHGTWGHPTSWAQSEGTGSGQGGAAVPACRSPTFPSTTGRSHSPGRWSRPSTSPGPHRCGCRSSPRRLLAARAPAGPGQRSCTWPRPCR